MASVATSLVPPADAATQRANGSDGASIVVRTPEDLTAQWLSSTIGNGVSVANFTATKTGTGQVSNCYRIELTYSPEGVTGPPSVVLKIASTDPKSRASGKTLFLYERESLFYKEIAPLMKDGLVAKCYHSSYDDEQNSYCLLLEDASPCTVGDDIKSATLEQAKYAMEALGKIHAPTIGNPEVKEKSWLHRSAPLTQAWFEQLTNGYLQRYESRIKPEHKEIIKRSTAAFDYFRTALQESPDSIMGVSHADFRLDNMLFRKNTDKTNPAMVVDWQTVCWGPVMRDVAYFFGCALTVETRRQHADELLEVYYKALGPDPKITMEQCKEGLRQESFFGITMGVVSPMLVERTERGDDMFMTMMERHCTQVLDLDALGLLPEAPKRTPLKPLPEDDARTHDTEPDPLWHESWYFDFADDSQGIGGWIRLGADPGRNRTWYTALICGPSRPTIAIADFRAPLPDEKLAIRKDGLQTKLECEDPLKQYRVTHSAQAEAYNDPSQLLQGKRGEPIETSVDLVWTTDGEPYQYRLATRYEIPCLVSGKLTIGDETLTISNCLGQRDHSWGRRDWWSMDWVWSAIHLSDGTHIHGVDLRIPDIPRVSVGYVQGPKQALTEVESCIPVEEFDENGLASATRMSLTTEDGTKIGLDMEMKGHGPLRLESDDGRVAMFPRAWGTVKLEDGRTGIAWMEWNRNNY